MPGGVFYWLKKLKYSHKKMTSPMWKQMRKGENNTKN
ncbi:MAG: hypothetical protein AB8B66_00115 [Rickettsiaceae bacterium]